MIHKGENTMKDTVVLYDIENLVGGYNLKYLSDISLKNILNALKEKNIHSIALQKAYADWSNQKLQGLKWEIAELGIEPIQMYGFSKGSTKNAADIQLVIDAMETLHTKPFITTVVIVSGDGGFSSLAKKYSEYGKRVIGCAYRQTTNAIFKKVCDDFIYIDETLSGDQIEKLRSIQMDENHKKHLLENPMLSNLSTFVTQQQDLDFEGLMVQCDKITKALKSNKIANEALNYEGLNISVFKSALNYAIKEFEPIQFGFPKFIDLLRFISFKGEIQLVLKEPSDYRLLNSGRKLVGFAPVEPLNPLEKPTIHNVQSYLNILATKQPVIKMPESISLFEVMRDDLLENRSKYLNIMFDDLVDAFLYLNFEEKMIRQVLYFMINTNILKGNPSTLPISEQFFYFKPETISEFNSDIKEAIIKKLERSFANTLDMSVVEQILSIVDRD